MNTCPCCSEQLLRHARHNRVYWFCPHCWQEMPNLSLGIAAEEASLEASLKRMNRLGDRLKLAH
jgi:ribosomal protein L37AE/L43A